MKRVSAVILNIALALSLCGCGMKKPAAAVPLSAADPGADGQTVSSVEIYNRTGKIQREDYYEAGNGNKLAYSVEYAYNDSGLLTSVRKNGGGIGSNAPMETYLYSGRNCTQRVLYDKNGGTEKCWYWTYGKDGALEKERVVYTVTSPEGKPVRAEELRTYDKDGNLSLLEYSSENDWARDEYGYDALGRLITDNYYHSSDGKTFRFFETVLYDYDEAGNIVRIQNRDSGGSVYLVEVFTYDGNGNVLSDTFYSSPDLTEERKLSEHLYEYGENGRLMFEADYLDGDMVQIYYEYDGKGNRTGITEKRYHDGKATDTVVTQTEYDDRSNPVKETVKGPGSEVKTVFVRSYEYYEDGAVKKITNYS